MRSPSACSTRACVWSAIHCCASARAGAASVARPSPGPDSTCGKVIETLRAHDNDIESTADYFAIKPAQVRACVGYYADFQDEIDAYAAELDAAQRERARWEREQRVLG